MSNIINVEEVWAIQARRRELNAIELEDAIFLYNGKPVIVDPSTIEEWKFVGLGNIDFVEMILSPDPLNPTEFRLSEPDKLI
jgi:hypothetical protein